jgi:hypothetical protein
MLIRQTVVLMILCQTVVLCFFIVAPVVMANDEGTENVAEITHSSDGGMTFDTNVHVPERPWEFVVIHHSATTSGSVESIHRSHRSRRDGNGKPWLGIGYHFVVGNGNGMVDGEISPSFRWTQQLHGAHSGSLRHNDRGIGICLIGNFEESKPTAAQRESVTKLIQTLADRYSIPRKRIIGHHQVRATACPGRHFPLKEIVEETVPKRVTQTYSRLHFHRAYEQR